MKTLRAYRWFNFLKAFTIPVMVVVLIGSQFPLSSQCYGSLFGSHHSGKMMCMKDGVCMMKMTDGQQMECQCHKKDRDRPFFCSCGSTAQYQISTLQLSKVLIPDMVTAEGNFSVLCLATGFSSPNSDSTSKDIFHPPQVG